jgi:hypothetical protein
MNDELEQQLREGLHRGSLPPAPDSLREGLAQLPSQPRGRRLTSVWSGLRVAALASAAAIALAFVLVVRALPGPAGTGPGSSLAGVGPGASASPSPGVSLAPTSLPSSVLPSLTPTDTPAPNPSAGPSTPENFSCAAQTILPATTNGVTRITDVRVGTHAGYDRIVFEFAGAGRPRLTVAVAHPPFVEDASGQPVQVAGSAFLTLKLYDANGYPTYTGPNSFSPGYPSLTALVNNGDYEGYVSWVAGLSHQACYSISTLTSPTRIVIDLQAP